MTPQEVLLRAVDVIHERGWWNRGLIGPDRSVCLVGAVHIAISGDVLDAVDIELRGRVLSRVQQELVSRIGELDFINQYNGEIAYWNDSGAEDADEICDVLKRAAER